MKGERMRPPFVVRCSEQRVDSARIRVGDSVPERGS
jgi:hypothetical protein